MSIGQFLKYHREYKGLSQKALADAVGISTSSLKQYERDDGPFPPTDKAAVLARVLDFDARDLFYEVFYPGDGLEKSKQRMVADDTLWEEVKDLTVAASIGACLDQISHYVSQRGLLSPHLPKSVQSAKFDLSKRYYWDLYDHAQYTNFDLKLFPKPDDVELENGEEFLGAASNALEDRLIIQAVYGEKLTSLSVGELRSLHKVLAQNLNIEWPLSGVPTSNLLGDFVRSKMDDEALQIDMLNNLAGYLIKSIVAEKPILIKETILEDYEAEMEGRPTTYDFEHTYN
jgi:transcriptional regulator with XRE-family HTH domain